MRKKALRKDFFMEWKKTLPRFLSILLIVALGVAFFSGIRASEMDIRYSLDAYYDEHRLMDLRIVSTAGLTDEDAVVLKDKLNVESVEGSYTQDMLTDIEGSQRVIHVMSETEKMNDLSIHKGHDIQKKNECLLDIRFAQNNQIKCGDTFTLYQTDSSQTCLLNRRKFRVVGFCASPQYVSFQRGSSGLGQGEVNAFMVVSKDAFSSDYYTQLDLRVSNASTQIAYTTGYDDLVHPIKEKIEDTIAPQRTKAAIERVRNDAQTKWESGKRRYLRAKKRYHSAQIQYEQGLSQLEFSHVYMLITEKQYQKQKQVLEQGKEKLKTTAKQLKQTRRQLLRAQKQIAQMDAPTWYVLDRNDLPQYDQGGENADRIAAIGKVFPVIFFLVAALISLTTMTRMVEEERTQIGILKALGYGNQSIATKYLWYAFLATAFGSVLGVLLGEKLIPWVIVTAYRIIFPDVTNTVIPYESHYSVLAAGVALCCTLLAAFVSCHHALKSNAAVLMRPVPPKNGKRIFLEHLPFLWKHFNFTQKSTLRNLFRYKKRFFMTIFGISGCMGLLVFGFGLKDSIYDVVTLQYGTLTHYPALIHVEENQSATLHKYLKGKTDVTAYTDLYMSSLSFLGPQKESKKKSAYLFIPENTETIQNYITLRNRQSQKNVSLSDDGVLVTEKLADQLHIKEGGTLRMYDQNKEYELHVSHIVENYMSHYVYMTPAYYKQVTGNTCNINTTIFQTKNTDEKTVHRIGEGALKEKGVQGITYLSSIRSQLDSMLQSLDAVILVIVGSAGLLAFVVLYNLNNININERRRELATIKVLGFYDPELASYVYRENILLTIIGVFLGAVFGKLLHTFIIGTVEIDSCMLARSIAPLSFVYAALFTAGFALFVNFIMYFKLKKIDMIESLKSVE